MPVFLRRYWVKRITAIIKERNESAKQQQKANKSKASTKRRR